jgi:nicotinate-nucleotide adenylyltransferase
VELKRSGKSYSFETIQYFRRKFGSAASLYFLIGLDAFLEINTWKEFALLFESCNFVIMSRPGLERNFAAEHLPVELARDFCYDTEKNGYLYRSGFFVFPKTVTALDISSTRIRQNFRDGRSVAYLIPAAVEEFIRFHKIYRE